ncbi:MAG: O-antigen ligase family protein [Vicinamibacterales bacterium]|nr:O-antigen ligase family protein [Vicinamibacterales bacterium]
MPDLRSGPPGWLVVALTTAYVVLAGVPELLPLRPLGRGAQAGDAIGAVLVAMAAWQVVAARRRPSSAATDLASLAWLLAVAAACLAGVTRGTLPAATAVRELAVVLSLVGVYGAVRVLATPGRLATVQRAFAWMAALGSAAGLLGMSLEALGIETPLVLPGTTSYPYLGTAARAQGFTASPAMLCSIAAAGGLAWLAVVCRDGASWVRATWWMPPLVAVGGLLLPFSKSTACLVAGLLLAVAGARLVGSARWRVAAGVAGMAVALAYLVLSHVTITTTPAVGRLVEGRFIAGAPLAAMSLGGEPLGVYRTNYWFNKAASVAAIREHWPWGLGPGGQNAFTAARMRDGRHPPTMWAADPHSTYVGTAAEVGLAGVVGLGAMIAALVGDLRASRARLSRDRRLLALAMAAAVYVALEAVTIDVMNFRHYWVAAALLASARTPCR